MISNYIIAEQPEYVRTPEERTFAHYLSEFQLISNIISGKVTTKQKPYNRLSQKAGDIKYEQHNRSPIGHFNYTYLDRQKIISGDFTPGYSWCNDEWDTDPQNSNLSEPQILVPHRIQAILPDSKIIFLLRNPIDRLMSDYNYHKHGEKSAEDFHNQVMKAINWWDSCTSSLSFRRCLYGLNYPQHLLPVGTSICQGLQRKGVITKCKTSTTNAWSINAASQLRRGLYNLYLKDWLEVFSRESILFIKFETYSQSPLEQLEKVVLPFLGLNKFDKSTRELLLQFEEQKKHSNANIKMLDETRRMLQSFYSPHIKELSYILKDKDFYWE